MSVNHAQVRDTEFARHPSTQRIRRFNAWFFHRFDRFIDWSLRSLKRTMFADLPSEIVEIGPGVGASFRYYPPGTNVTAIEPNTHMHRHLRENARARGINLTLSGLAEDTGLDAESVDAVVSSLVLCTVTNPAAVVGEVSRILRPGGRFIVLEHVHGRRAPLRALQRLVARPWRWLFEGCELDRHTKELIERDASFTTSNLEERAHTTPFLPINRFVVGHVVK